MSALPVSGMAILAMLSTLFIPACRMPTATDGADIISNLRFSPGAFDSFRRNTEVLYTLSRSARVSFSIVRRTTSGDDQPVVTLFSALFESRGTHSHTWLGDSSQGLFAPPGDYVGIIVVDGRRYEAVVRVFHF